MFVISFFFIFVMIFNSKKCLFENKDFLFFFLNYFVSIVKLLLLAIRLGLWCMFLNHGVGSTSPNVLCCVKAAAHEACFNHLLSACFHSKTSQDQAGKQIWFNLLNQASKPERQPAVRSFRSRQAPKLQTECSHPKNRQRKKPRVQRALLCGLAI